jgi:thiol-disulfide isomerase/thioredoxin
VLKLSTTLATSLTLATLLSVGCDRGSHPENINRPAPQFTISDEQNSFDLSKYRGKVVIVNLWATWCAPCIQELPSLLKLHQKMPDVAIVALSWDEDATKYHEFLTDYHIDLLTIRDPEQQIGKLYGTVQIPETYVIDRQGNLRRKFVSAQDWTSPEIVNFLRHL